MNVREIASAAARDDDLTPDLRIVFYEESSTASFTSLDRAQQSGSTAADDDHVEFHL